MSARVSRGRDGDEIAIDQNIILAFYDPIDPQLAGSVGSMHDSLAAKPLSKLRVVGNIVAVSEKHFTNATHRRDLLRSEEHTSELQSLAYLVCRLLLEKKKKQQK